MPDGKCVLTNTNRWHYKGNQYIATMDDLNNINKTTMVYGTYIGDGTSVRTISLSFYPKCCIILSANGRGYDNADRYGGIVLLNNPLRHSCVYNDSYYTNTLISISNNTLVLNTYDDSANAININNNVYYYVLFA